MLDGAPSHQNGVFSPPPSGKRKPDPAGEVVWTENKGPFLRPCPGTRNHICCGYRILHVGTGCPLNCSYCILQAYLNDPRLRMFTNRDRMASELIQATRSSPHRLFRLGTGEFTDSLYLEHRVRFAEFIAPLVQGEPNLVLELKTKTDNVEPLLELENPDRLIVSFSLNSPFIARREERGAASLTRRIRAAQRCREHGFKVGFHFDPLVLHPHWQREYAEIVERVFERVDPAGVIWISLGCLRFMPELKVVARRRHPHTPIFSGEFVRGSDGKMRYFRPIREEMYAVLAGHIRRFDPGLCIYLCMESDRVWRNAMGWSPGTSAGLAAYLDRRTLSFFPSLHLGPVPTRPVLPTG